jgi:hypothetical protein
MCNNVKPKFLKRAEGDIPIKKEVIEHLEPLISNS